MRHTIRSGRSARRLVLGTAMGAVLGALLLTGCSTTASNGSGDDADAAGPGLTDTTIKIGFVVLDQMAGGSGFITADQGDAREQVNAMVDAVNADGGIAGREIEPVFQEFDTTTDSVQTESALCTAFTEDDAVFAVVLLGQREPSARQCYKDANTLMLDASGLGLPKSVYDDLAPFFFAVSTTTLDAYAETEVDVLDEAGFFDGAKVGVLIEANDDYRQVYEDVLKPALADVGATDPVTAEIDQTTAANAGATVGAAASKFKAEGVTALLFLGRGDNVGYFTAIAGPQKYYPKLAVGSFENPGFASRNPALFPKQALQGSQGLGISPTDDGLGSSLPFPQPGAETECVDIYAEAGIEFESRDNANRAFLFCDALRFLQAAAAEVGEDDPLNATSLADAAGGLGDTWQSAIALGTDFEPGVYAPASVGRLLAYVGPDFAYQGSDAPLANP